MQDHVSLPLSSSPHLAAMSSRKRSRLHQSTLAICFSLKYTHYIVCIFKGLCVCVYMQLAPFQTKAPAQNFRKTDPPLLFWCVFDNDTLVVYLGASFKSFQSPFLFFFPKCEVMVPHYIFCGLMTAVSAEKVPVWIGCVLYWKPQGSGPCAVLTPVTPLREDSSATDLAFLSEAGTTSHTCLL